MTLDNLAFTSIREDSAAWLERDFEEEEVKAVVFDLGGDKVLGPDGFPLAFFQQLCELTKKDIMVFIKDFHSRCGLPKHAGASFITLIPKKKGADCLKDFRPIRLLGSMYKILAKVLAGRLHRVLPSIISQS